MKKVVSVSLRFFIWQHYSLQEQLHYDGGTEIITTATRHLLQAAVKINKTFNKKYS